MIRGRRRQEGAAVENRPISVLYVDDYDELCRLAKAGLEEASERIGVDTTTEPGSVTERLGEFDCIVSDYRMPETNGLELLRQVRVLDEDVPFILFTGRGSEGVASDAISLGVTDYISKSGSHERFTRLANRIEGAVRAHRASETVERTRSNARNTIERERAIADCLLEVTSTPRLVVDETGEVIRANRRALKTFDLSEGDLLGVNLAGPNAHVETGGGQPVPSDELVWTTAIETERRYIGVEYDLSLPSGRFRAVLDVVPATRGDAAVAVVSIEAVECL